MSHPTAPVWIALPAGAFPLLPSFAAAGYGWQDLARLGNMWQVSAGNARLASRRAVRVTYLHIWSRLVMYGHGWSRVITLQPAPGTPAHLGAVVRRADDQLRLSLLADVHAASCHREHQPLILEDPDSAGNHVLAYLVSPPEGPVRRQGTTRPFASAYALAEDSG